MNKGKENYNNIPLPDGLSDAIRTEWTEVKNIPQKNGLPVSALLPPPACVWS
ncbi:MAG: hypothetical protein ACLVLH_25200 [Eisenbergiella massiliensis]